LIDLFLDCYLENFKQNEEINLEVIEEEKDDSTGKNNNDLKRVRMMSRRLTKKNIVYD